MGRRAECVGFYKDLMVCRRVFSGPLVLHSLENTPVSPGTLRYPYCMSGVEAVTQPNPCGPCQSRGDEPQKSLLEQGDTSLGLCLPQGFFWPPSCHLPQPALSACPLSAQGCCLPRLAWNSQACLSLVLSLAPRSSSCIFPLPLSQLSLPSPNCCPFGLQDLRSHT